MKNKLNFNFKSAQADLSLAGVLIAAVISVGTALGFKIPVDAATTWQTAAASLIGLLSALGILTTSTDKGGNDVQK